MCFNPNGPDNGDKEGSDAEDIEASVYDDPEKVRVRFMLTDAHQKISMSAPSFRINYDTRDKLW